ncbi:hypothetical protein ACFQZT_06500 [Paenibacillus sp. GCM10027628]
MATDQFKSVTMENIVMGSIPFSLTSGTLNNIVNASISVPKGRTPLEW